MNQHGRKTSIQNLRRLLHKIGLLYFKQERFHESLDYFMKSLDIYKKVLPTYHSFIESVIKDVKKVYRCAKNFQ